MAGSFVGAPGDYLEMTVDVVVTSAQRVEASSASCFALRGTVNLSSFDHAVSFQQLRTAEATLMQNRPIIAGRLPAPSS
jgi:hypothetical protein